MVMTPLIFRLWRYYGLDYYIFYIALVMALLIPLLRAISSSTLVWFVPTFVLYDHIFISIYPVVHALIFWRHYPRYYDVTNPFVLINVYFFSPFMHTSCYICICIYTYYYIYLYVFIYIYIYIPFILIYILYILYIYIYIYILYCHSTTTSTTTTTTTISSYLPTYYLPIYYHHHHYYYYYYYYLYNATSTTTFFSPWYF